MNYELPEVLPASPRYIWHETAEDAAPHTCKRSRKLREAKNYLLIGDPNDLAITEEMQEVDADSNEGDDNKAESEVHELASEWVIYYGDVVLRCDRDN